MNNNGPKFHHSIGNDNTIPPGQEGKAKQSLNPGDTLGQYKVIRLLGRGGMGEVYEVEHQTLQRRYALKLLPAEISRKPEMLERFRREARVMANLEHPNIVKVDEFGETDGRCWLRMELANGGKINNRKVCSLEDYANANNGRLPPEDAQVIFSQILEGLAHAHEKGVIHRDLKPTNILIFSDDDGYATFKIADFGLVRMVGEEWLRSQTDKSVRLSMSMGNQATAGLEAAGSSTRSLIGTYEYMSPEQKRGEEATAASDVYSVGLMMYRLLTGLPELSRKSVSQHLGGSASAWDDLIDQAVEPDASIRFNDAAALLDVLPSPPVSVSASTTQPISSEENKQNVTTKGVSRQSEGNICLGIRRIIGVVISAITGVVLGAIIGEILIAILGEMFAKGIDNLLVEKIILRIGMIIGGWLFGNLALKSALYSAHKQLS